MATLPRNLKIRRNRIIKKYDKLVGKTIDKMKDASMAELWAELDILKKDMVNELNEAGVVLES